MNLSFSVLFPVALLFACGVEAAPPSRAAAASEFPETWSAFKSSPRATDKRLVASIEKMQLKQVCFDWGHEARGATYTRRERALREFLISKRMLNNKDRGHVMDRTVDVGMTECGVFAALGQPYEEYRMGNREGVISELIYRTPPLRISTEKSPDYAINVVREVHR